MNELNMGVNLLGVLHNIDRAQRGVSSTQGFLYKHLNNMGAVEAIVDCQLSEFQKKSRLIKNVSMDKNVWALNSGFDVTARKMRSANINATTIPDKNFNAVLQIGSEFSTVNVTKLLSVPKFSYHDDNVFRYFKSRQSDLNSAQIDRLSTKYRIAFEYEKEVYDGLDAIFCISESLRNVFIEDFLQPESKVHAIGYGANIDINLSDCGEKDYGKKVILIIAKDSFREKGGESLLKALPLIRKEYSDARLVVIGQEEKQKVDGVEWAGYLDKNNPADMKRFKEIMSSTTLYVMPSFVEAAGGSFLEAMSYGIPCIGARQGATIEIIEGNDSGVLVDDNDHRVLAEKIIALFDSERELQRLGANARTAIKEKYNWQKVCNKALAVMKTFI